MLPPVHVHHTGLYISCRTCEVVKLRQTSTPTPLRPTCARTPHPHSSYPNAAPLVPPPVHAHHTGILILQSMPDGKTVLNEYSYTVAANACVNPPPPPRPHRIFMRLPSCLPCPDVHHTGVFILQSMRDSGIAPNEYSYTAAANACAKNGDWKGALKLLGQMRERDGVEPNEFTYTAAVRENNIL